MLEEKLPKEIEIEWIKLITTKGNEHIKDDKFPALLSLLLENKERLEYKHSSMRSETTTKISSCHVSSKGDERTETVNRPFCWLHPNKNDHPIWRCKDFETKPYT